MTAQIVVSQPALTREHLETIARLLGQLKDSRTFLDIRDDIIRMQEFVNDVKSIPGLMELVKKNIWFRSNGTMHSFLMSCQDILEKFTMDQLIG